jgi:hypothetical protein
MYREPSWEFNWTSTSDPLYGNTIDLPEGLLLWRAYEPTTDPINSRPSQYSSKSAATVPTKSLGAFVTTRELHLLDIRFVSVLLQRLFETWVGRPCIPSDAMCIRAATISLGLSSATHQVRLMKQFYVNDPENLSKTDQMEQGFNKNSFIETPGIRIKEPTAEGITLFFLKALLQDRFDGLLSPPTSDDHSSIEIILFDPKQSGIDHVKGVPKTLSVRHLTEFTTGYRPRTTVEYPYTVSTIFTPEYPAIEQFNDRVRRKDPDALRLIKQAEEAGKKWHWQKSIYTSIPPHPCVPLSIFTRGNLELN